MPRTKTQKRWRKEYKSFNGSIYLVDGRLHWDREIGFPSRVARAVTRRQWRLASTFGGGVL